MPATRTLSLLLAGALVAFSTLTGVTAPSAATTGVADATALRSALASATAGDTVQLTANIGAAGSPIGNVDVPVTVTLDLAGHILTTNSIVVAASTTLTIEDSATGGTLNATTSSDLASGPIALASAAAATGHIIISSGIINATATDFYSTAIGGSATGGSVTINGGTVTASAVRGAGIGSGPGSSVGTNSDNLTVTINGGSVTASSTSGAGIGSGNGRIGLAVTITGGTVVASSTSGAGIGGGQQNRSDVHPIIISGGSVTASSVSGSGIGAGEGYSSNQSLARGAVTTISGDSVVVATSSTGTGIGGGTNGPGNSVTIGEGADVTASATGTGGKPIGSGAGVFQVGTLVVAGTLRVTGPRSLNTQLVNNSFTVESTGVVTGTGTLAGPGAITNNGAITLPDASVTTATVNVNNYAVTFDANHGVGSPTSSVRVLAPSFATGNRAFPSPSYGLTLLGWNTQRDGSGTAFTTETALTAPLTVYAQWALASIEVSAPATATAGDTLTLSAEGFGPGNASLGDQTPRVTFSSSVASDVITGSSVLVTEAGPRTFTASLTSDTAVTDTTTTTVNAAAPARIASTVAPSSITTGDSVTVTTLAYDEYDNLIGDVSDDTDTITGDTATLTTLGNRTITVSYLELTTTVTVTVVAAVIASIEVSAPATATAGDTLALSAEGFGTGGASLGDQTPLVTFTSSVASDVITGSSVVVTEAGPRTFTATLTSNTGVRDTATTAVDAAAPSRIVSTVSSSSVAAQSSVTVTTLLFDEYGNFISDVTDESELSTIENTDIITGDAVTLVAPGNRTITVTYLDLTTTVSVTVIAAAPAVAGTPPAKVLGSTGIDLVLPLGGGALLLLLGAMALLVSASRARRA